MNILIVWTAMPFPPTDGGRRAIYFPIKVLSEAGHRVHFACVTDRYDPVAIKAMERFCTIDVVESSKRRTIPGALKSMLSSVPYDVRRFHNRELLARLRMRVSTGAFDVLHAEGIHAAFYALELRRDFDIPIVLRHQTIQHVNYLRSAGKYANPLLNLYLRMEGLKLRRYEIACARQFDQNLVISEHDGQVLRKLEPELRCTTIPAGVDLDELRPGDGQPEPNTVLWLGALGWEPNRDSFWWFYHHIVPLLVRKVPQVRIRVVGSSPSAEILAIRHPNVHVVGFLPEIQPAVQKAAVCVVPLRIGAGIRMKLLELFAMRKAVVSTTIGAEGLHVENGTHLLLADDPPAFADAISSLLSDETLRNALAGNAYEHVRQSYAWNRVLPLYEKAYGDLLVQRNSHTGLARS